MSSLLSMEWPLLTILTTNGSKTKNFQKEHKHVFFGRFFFFRQNWAKLQSVSLSLYEPKVRNTLGDTLLQHVRMTNHWLATGQATSCVTRCNNKPLYVLENFSENLCLGNRILSLNKSNWFEFVWLVAGTKFCCGDKGFHKIPQYTQRNLSLQCVAAMCWCNLSPSVFVLKDYHW